MATVYLVSSGSEQVSFTKNNCSYSGTTLWCTTGSQSTKSGSYKYTYSCPSGSKVYVSCGRTGWGTVYDASVNIGGTTTAIGSSVNTNKSVSGSTSIGFDFYVNGWESGGAGVGLTSPTIYITYTSTYTLTVRAGTGISSVTGGGTYNEGSSKQITATVSTGYTWSKWQYTSGGSQYTTTQNPTITVNSNLDLTAVATANPYTIAYNNNGGSGTMSSTSATYGTYVTLRANTFTKDKYIFKGWATSSTGSKVYDNQQSVINLTTTKNGTVTLYAVWEKDPNAVFVNTTKVYSSGWK